MFRTVGTLNDALDVYSYWTFTDVFEEGGMPRVEYKNVYGSMTVSGVPKPVWRAFELLNTHAGNRRVHVRISNQAEPMPPPPREGMPVTEQGSQKTRWAVAVPCNEADPSQLHWSFEGGALKWSGDGSTSCIDSIAGAEALQLTRCNYLQPSQVFSVTKHPWLSFVQYRKCLDVFLPDPSAYRRVDLYACNSGTNQQFNLTASGSLMARNNACIAVRDKSAGPPPPPPAPPPAPKPYVSAFATRNSTVGPPTLSSMRVFLSFWAEPGSTSALADRKVTVTVRHAPDEQIEDLEPDAYGGNGSLATVYSINDEHVRPSAAWKAMGAPNRPNASQLEALLEASRTHVERVAIKRLNASYVSVEVTMVENSVAVVAFGLD